MRAVAVVVFRIRVIVGEVVTVEVVDEPVAVLIDAVHDARTIPARTLRRIGPHIRLQVGVSIVDTRVDHAHDHVAGARVSRPGFRSIYIGIRDSATGTCVLHAP